VKRLILLRHAKSSWSDSSLADAERPLSVRGESDAPLMGDRLRERGARPDVIIASPSARTRRTAKLIARKLGYPEGEIKLEPALYLAGPDTVLEIIAAQAGLANSVIVVGHNPGLTALVNRLLPDFALDDLPTTGAVALDLETEIWTNLLDAPRRLAYYDYPKNMAPATPVN
jgi:phosphohistidine phosphatase